MLGWLRLGWLKIAYIYDALLGILQSFEVLQALHLQTCRYRIIAVASTPRRRLPQPVSAGRRSRREVRGAWLSTDTETDTEANANTDTSTSTSTNTDTDTDTDNEINTETNTDTNASTDTNTRLLISC